MIFRDCGAMSDPVVFFVVTDARCVVRGNAYPGIPIFFDANGVIECCRSHYFVGDFSVYSWSTEARFVTLTRHRRRAEPERFGWRGKAARQ